MIRKPQFINMIRQGEFRDLFVSELGWNRYRGQSEIPRITIDSRDYDIKTIAERSGFQVLTCEVDEIPTQSVARKIDSRLRRQAQDYICIYRLRNTAHDLWVVPVRANEKRDLVLIEYEAAEKAELLYSKIDGFSFALDEATNIVDLRAKVQGAFAVNSEKITKDFYSGFKKEHKAFAEFITGIDDHVAVKENKNKQWYTSVMLNRLMFCYFIQKKGFLNFDTDYLRHKLDWVRREQGENRFFQSFYRGFLSRLFHDGLNMPKRDAAFVDMYGRIPYLNGGMFEEHQLERDYAYIDIADEAFIRLFDFFDKWRWHLDTRITASGKDINPDVLGYIFEQYINDRAQMGAYYTKEDITEYIGKNCILPFLIDKVSKDMPEAFTPDGYVWKYLRESGDRYIYDAVRRGYTPDWRKRLPSEIAKGLITEEMREEYCETPVGKLPDSHIPLAQLRSEWNRKTPEEFALPTEIWRETIDRFERCDTLLEKIASGKIQSINDFITLNLDIRSFVYDILQNTDNHHLIRKFYKALQEVTVLDPTCGSGAFLFAAMNILEPLYEVCIERMQEFNTKNPKLFKEQLTELSKKYRSNIQYFIFKSIILRNLYGVDIMVEATEIAKLRLFLKMVAVVDVDRHADNMGLDPLPDIDFNIRCGNTLVGYANEEQLKHDLTAPAGDLLAYEANLEFKKRIDEEMRLVAMAYHRFRELQLVQEMNMADFKQAKHDLRERLYSLNDLLNHRQYEAARPDMSYSVWLTSHQPFNWLAEFYQIIHDNGGFDVIIGNPPYVEYNKKSSSTKRSVADIYQLINYDTLSCGNLYAFVIERSIDMGRPSSKIGFIIPSASISTPRMLPLSRIMQSNGKLWSSLWDERPSTLFDGVCIQLSIHLLSKEPQRKAYTSSMYHWNNESRSVIFQGISYVGYSNEEIIADVSPKISSSKERNLISKLFDQSIPLKKVGGNSDSKANIYYKNAGGRYWRLVKSFPTYYKSDRGNATSTEKIMEVAPDRIGMVVVVLSSSLFYWYWRIVSNCRHLTNRELDIFPIHNSLIENSDSFEDLRFKFEKDLNKNKERIITHSETKGDITQDFFFVKYSKGIIDEIDTVLARHYGFTEEELDFIINYDIKYRMGDELNNQD